MQKMLAESLDCFQAVLEALKVLLGMMAHVLSIAEGGTFEIHHILFGGNHMLTTMAHNPYIVLLCQSLVVSSVSCKMGPSSRTGEHLEIVAAKASKYSLVVLDVINLQIAQIECLCSVCFRHYYLMLPHWHLGIVVRQTAHLLDP